MEGQTTPKTLMPWEPPEVKDVRPAQAAGGWSPPEARDWSPPEVATKELPSAADFAPIDWGQVNAAAAKDELARANWQAQNSHDFDMVRQVVPKMGRAIGVPLNYLADLGKGLVEDSAKGLDFLFNRQTDETPAGGPFDNLAAALRAEPRPFHEQVAPEDLGLGGEISQSISGMLPLLPLAGGLGAGLRAVGARPLVASSIAAGTVFGFNPEGDFDPQQSAIMAAFPFVSKFGGSMGVKAAEKMGLDIAIPGVQKAVHLAGGYAASQAYIDLTQLPTYLSGELTEAEKWHTFAHGFGVNLALHLPQAMGALPKMSIRPVIPQKTPASPRPYVRPGEGQPTYRVAGEKPPVPEPTIAPLPVAPLLNDPLAAALAEIEAARLKNQAEVTALDAESARRVASLTPPAWQPPETLPAAEVAGPKPAAPGLVAPSREPETGAPVPSPPDAANPPVDTPPPPAQTTPTYEPGQPRPNPPGVDVREPARPVPPTPPAEQAGAAPRPEDAGSAPGDNAAEGPRPERRRSVPTGQRPDPDTIGRPGNVGQPPETAPAPGAGSDLQAAGGVTAEQARIDAGTKRVGDTARDLNHILPADADWIPTGDKAKVRANLDAIKLLKQLETENRNPTPEEKAKLAQYTGWGGLKEIFDEGKAAYRDRPPWSEEQKKEAANWEKGWGKLYDEVNATLTPEEHAAAGKSILNAHYTSREIINGVWKGVQRLGFKGGRALEPSSGIGHFVGLTPEALRGKTKWTGVELDSISGRIAQKLYPESLVHQMGFQDAKIAPNSQDLVISNFPFAADGPIDKRYPRLSLHNYFFARALDVVKPGGIVVAITSDSTMDGGRSGEARKHFAEKADLVGAIRLPNTAFKKNAGTEVTTDILFFRKRDGTPFQGAEFKHVVPAETYKGEPININEYFVAHPEMMLGRMSLEGTMYRADQQALVPTPGADLNRQLEEAISKLPENVMGKAAPTVSAGTDGPRAEKSAKMGGLVQHKDGRVMMVNAGGELEMTDWGADAKKQKQAVDYIAVRDQSKTVIGKMLDTDATEGDIKFERGRLNSAYDNYFKKHGRINERKSSFLDDDVDFPLALALEDGTTKLVDLPGGKAKRVTEWTKAKIFSERTLFPRVAPSSVDTVSDGLQVSQNFQGKVDPDYIAQLTSRPVESVKAELEGTGQAFENPESGQWENRPTYLSGFVKKKLAAARNAAESDPRYLKHVAELEKVQPPAIPFENIGVKLGSVFVPEKTIERFLLDHLEVDAKVSFTPQTGDWKVTARSGDWGAKNKQTWGIHDWKGHELVEAALNLKSPTVTKTEMRTGQDGKSREAEVKDAPKTLEAQQKQQQLATAFKDWMQRIASNETRTEIEQIYNARYNGVVAPKFEAPAWAHYPGASTDVTLREHQKAVVTRMLQNSTLLAHAVGTGKTYAMTTAAMEMRRLGLAKKPMIVVQNATLEQFARSFKRLYPTARILAPNAKQRDSTNRNRTMSRIATGDWDAVIVPQSFVNMLPDNPVREAGYIRDRIAELRSAKIEANNQEGKKSPKASDLQKAIERMEKKLGELADRAQDNVLTFEQTGVDALFVDEAHAYKKLEFSTKMDNIKGLDLGSSQRGWSMHMKTRWVQERNQGRNVIFATGTPISNTVAEAWNMMRYVRPDVLKEYGIEKFDDFASTFGDTVTQLEMTSTGDWKPVTRFARFTNGPELISAWRTVADVVTAEEVNLPGLPSLKNGKPQAVNIPQTPDISRYVGFLRSELARFAAMSGKEKRENSHIPLVVMTLARKAMPDMRMIDPDLPDQPESKLNKVVANVLEVYRDSTGAKGAQMIFQDLYQDNPKAPRFNLYQELKRKLVAGGIPESEILIVDETIKDAKRDAMFTKLNDGDIRVAIGGTEKMGVGVNAQEHLIAVHHVSPPLRPMDIEQRNGRILRQGNQNPEVQIFNYGVEKSLDSALYQLLATKQKFINQILRGNLQGRNFEDAANEQSLSFEDAMAAFSGDPRAMQKVGLENQVRQMEMLRSGHAEQMRKARETIQQLHGRILPYQEKQAADSKRRAAVFEEAFPAGGDYTLEAGDKTITGRKEVAEKLDAIFKAGLATAQVAARGQFGQIDVPLGETVLNGQKIKLRGVGSPDAKGIINPDSIKIAWEFTDGGQGGQSTTGAGFFHSLAATLERIASLPDQHARSLGNEQRNLRELNGFVTQPFEREAELAQSRETLAKLTAELEAEGKTPLPSGQPGTEQTPPAPTSSENSGESEVEHGFSGNTTLVQAAAQDVARLRNLVAPQTAGGPARFAGNLLRELNAKMANELARADVALQTFRRDFDRTPVNTKKFKFDPTLPLPRNFAFIDAYENGNTAALSPTDAVAATELHKLNRADLARVHTLGTGALTTFYANYFPHIWDNPKLAASVFAKILGRAPLEGPKSFLKQRTHQMFTDGLAAGLKPVHDNPVDLWLLKKREIERYILAHNFTAEMKKAGLMKFKYVFGKAPEGWATVNDSAFSVHGPPTVTIKEAFDAGMREATLDLLKDLGVPHERLARIGGKGRWGYEVDVPGRPGTERIVTKFGGPDFVIWHELGHVFHNRYADLKRLMTATPAMEAELTALATERLDSTSPKSFRANVETMPEKMAVVLQAYVHAPELMGKIAPTVKLALESFIKAHPELEPINDIRPGLRLGVGEAELSHGGLLKLGDYIMPEAAAKVVNNFLSPGLNPHLWYRTLRQTSNLLNGVQLGLSAFHLGFTSLDAATSRLAIGLEDLVQGKPLRGLGAIASSPAAAVSGIRTGGKLRAEVLRPGTHPEMAALAKALEKAGGRVGLDAFWQTEFTRRMTRAWHEGGLQWATLPLRVPLAAWEQTMRPILEYIVPRQKLGVFADMASREIERLGPAADEGSTREALRKAWDSVDNRMGQVVYDNLFYNRAVKDVALIAFRAYGWQLGKYREGIGALIDTSRAAGNFLRGKPGEAEFTHRMAYAMALPIMVGTIGALIHYLMTGKKPEEALDYFQPKTGELDRNGNPVRVNLPSYLKDAFSYSKHPVTSFGHSLNPLLSSMFDLLQNADFYNVEIRHPDDPVWKQGGDVAEFAVKQFIPFSVSGSIKLAEDDAPAWKRIAPYFGVTPVSQRMTMTPAQELASELTAARMPRVPRTKDKFDEAKVRGQIVADWKRGQQEKALAGIGDAVDARTLHPDQLRVMVQKMNLTPLQFQVMMMDSESGLRVWRLGTPPERESVMPFLASKIQHSKTVPGARKVEMIREITGQN